MIVVTTCLPGFADIQFNELEELNEHDLDALPFGVIGMSEHGIVEVYNQTESKLAGLSPDKVLGAHFFSTIAQCMNNFLVAQLNHPLISLQQIPY